MEDERRYNKCVAPIKQEFVVKHSKSFGHNNKSCNGNDQVADEKATDVVNEDENVDFADKHTNLFYPPPAKKPRGMNRNRQHTNKPVQNSRGFCYQFLKNECELGDECKFSHDVISYWASKPADLGSVCPIFEKYGFCRYGITCRYAESHVDVKLINKKREIDGSDSEQQEPDRPLNVVDSHFRNALSKREYQFTKSEPILDSLSTEDSKPADGAEITLKEPRVPKKMTGKDFKDKLYLAPLTTVGNLPFRRLCVQFGAEITCGEMALATEILKGNRSEWALLGRHPSEKIFGVQLCGGFPDTMTKCAEILTEKCEVDFVDINVGCPIDLICDKGAGCALMNKPKKLAQITRCMDQVLGDIPLTLKMRTGVHKGKNIAHSLVANLQDWNVALCTVHGRSRDQRYTKLADWYYVNSCAQAAEGVPIFGCGDILSYEDYFDKLEENPDVAGAMIARGALIKPWIFTEIKEKRHWDIRSSERFDIMKQFVHFGLEHWGSDEMGVHNTRRFLLEWLSFSHRYIPVGLLETLPQRMNERPPQYTGRDDLETLMASTNCRDWIKLTEMLLGPIDPNFRFTPKHKANSYEG